MGGGGCSGDCGLMLGLRVSLEFIPGERQSMALSLRGLKEGLGTRSKHCLAKAMHKRVGRRSYAVFSPRRCSND